jgi:heme a synthase
MAFIGQRSTPSKGLHRFAVVTAVVTFPLIFVGGLVTSHDVGLAVPDWPTTYGYNMFLYPWHKMVGGIFLEHSHRLLGSLLGILMIVLTFWIFKEEKERKWIRVLTLTILALIIFQGILGGARVLFLKREIAIFHACLAQVVFCLLAAVALFTSRFWQNLPSADASRSTLRNWTLFMTVAIFVQLALGAVMRHTESGLAIPDFPMMYGQWIPPLDSAQLEQVTEIRRWTWNLDPVALWQIGVHFAHRVGAIAVSIFVFGTVWLAWSKYRQIPGLFFASLLLVVLLVVQVILGMFVIWTGEGVNVTTAHVAVGALTFMTSFLLTIIAFKISCCSASKTADTVAVSEGVTT